MLMLANTCCVCGNADVTIVGQKDERVIGKCTTCSLVYTLQRPFDYEQLYTEGSRYHVDRIGHIPYRTRHLHDVAVAESRVKKLHKYAGAFDAHDTIQADRLAGIERAIVPRSLDVGCANGAFVEVMCRSGYGAEGLELNPGMAEWAREHTGAKIHTNWDTVRAPFDVISYHDVIEHIAEPVEELERIYEYLTPNGLLILDTPDGGDPTFLADILGNKHTKPKEHLWFFSQAALEALLSITGFCPPEIDHPIPGKLVAYARRKA